MSTATWFRLLGLPALAIVLGFAGTALTQEEKEKSGKGADEKDKVLILKKTDRAGKLELSWPDPLKDADFDKPRQALTKKLGEAVAVLKKGKRPTAELLKTIQGDHKAMIDKLAEKTDDLTPAQYIV